MVKICLVTVKLINFISDEILDILVYRYLKSTNKIFVDPLCLVFPWNLSFCVEICGISLEGSEAAGRESQKISHLEM